MRNRLKLLPVSLAAAAGLLVAPLAGDSFRDTHNSLTWEAVGRGNGTTVKSRYVEHVGHPVVRQDLVLSVAGAPPGATLLVALNGRDLLALPADGAGSALFDYSRFGPAGADGRPAPNRRIETGDVLRVHNLQAGVDVSAAYAYVP